MNGFDHSSQNTLASNSRLSACDAQAGLAFPWRDGAGVRTCVVSTLRRAVTEDGSAGVLVGRRWLSFGALGLMRAVAIFVFCATVASAAAAEKTSVDLPRFGQLPIPNGWRVLDRGSYGNTNQPSHWAVLQKGDKAEYLSFYAFGRPRSQITNAIVFADTAHEIFPDGRIAAMIKPPSTYSRETSVWSLRVGLVAVNGYEALEYSFVCDFEGKSDNLLAHGYVLFGDFAMIVQHTSDRPSTPEFVMSVAAQTMRTLSKISAPKNLKTK